MFPGALIIFPPIFSLYNGNGRFQRAQEVVLGQAHPERLDRVRPDRRRLRDPVPRAGCLRLHAKRAEQGLGEPRARRAGGLEAPARPRGVSQTQAGPRPRRPGPPAPSDAAEREPKMSEEKNIKTGRRLGGRWARRPRRGVRVPQGPQGPGRRGVRDQRDRDATRLRLRLPLPRHAGGALLRPQRRDRDHLRRRRRHTGSAPAGWRASMRRSTAASRTSARPTPSTWSPAARAATWAATAAPPTTISRAHAAAFDLRGLGVYLPSGGTAPAEGSGRAAEHSLGAVILKRTTHRSIPSGLS